LKRGLVLVTMILCTSRKDDLLDEEYSLRVCMWLREA
jgi:hypothetical protein